MRWPGATGSNDGIFDTSDDAMSIDDVPSERGRARPGGASTFAQRFKSWEYSRDRVVNRFDRRSPTAPEDPREGEGGAATSVSRPAADTQPQSGCSPAFTADNREIEESSWEDFEQQQLDDVADLPPDVELDKDDPLMWLEQVEPHRVLEAFPMLKRIPWLRGMLGGGR